MEKNTSEIIPSLLRSIGAAYACYPYSFLPGERHCVLYDADGKVLGIGDMFYDLDSYLLSEPKFFKQNATTPFGSLVGALFRALDDRGLVRYIEALEKECSCSRYDFVNKRK